ncbi:DNA-binding response regulator [Streptomyces albidoflavus]|nr:DNA-binding response regulator [Streptomyces albidoflavus]
MSTQANVKTISVAFSSENEVRRLGLEQLLRRIPIVDHFTIHSSSMDLMASAGLNTDIFVVPIKELQLAPAHFIGQLPSRSKTLLILNGVPDECLSYIAAAPAHGFLSDYDLSAETLTDTLQRMMDGESPMPLELTKKLLERASQPYSASPDRPALHLTPREQEVLGLLVDGLSNKQIASRLQLSQHSVKRLVTTILAKLNSPNRTSAAATALREGLVYRDEAGAAHRMARAG